MPLSRTILKFLACGFLACLVSLYALHVFAFNGPSGSAGSGGGALGIDAANNISIGTSTTQSNVKLLIVASSSDTSNYAIKILNGGLIPALLVRNDGSIAIGTTSFSGGTALTVNGTLYSTNGFTGTVSAGNITPGVFNGSTGGNYAVNGSLGVGTTTQVSLPQSLSVYGGGYFTGSVGLGTSAPSFNTVSNGIDISGGKAGVRFDSTTGGTTGVEIWADANGLNFQNLNSSRNFIFTTGGVAIGTSTLGGSALMNIYGSGAELRVSGTANGNSGWISFYTPAGRQGYLQGDAGGYEQLDFSGQGKLDLTGGNVGIGLTSPGSKLEVAGNTSSSQFCLGGTCISTWNGSQWVTTSTGVYYNSGNVGIGTANPSTPLSVAGNITLSNGQIIISGSDAGVVNSTRFIGNGANASNLWFNVPTGGAHVLSVNGTQILNVLGTGVSVVSGNFLVPNGNVGIGTTSSLSKLNVQADAAGSAWTLSQVTISGNTDSNRRLALGYDTTDNLGFIQAGDAGVAYEPLILNAAGGNVGIGTTQPSSTLHVIGGGTFTQPVIVGTPVAANQAATKNYVDTAISAATSSEWVVNGSNLYNANSGNIGIGSTTVPTLFSVATGSPIFNVLSNGNVGIGNSAPGSPLEVDMNQNVSGGALGVFALVNNYTGQNQSYSFQFGGTALSGANAKQMSIVGGSSASEIQFNDQNGSTGNAVLIAMHNDTSVGHAVYIASTPGQTGDIFHVASSSSGTTFFNVTGAGRVGIGTASPGAQLDVQGGTVNVGANGSAQSVTLWGNFRSANPTAPNAGVSTDFANDSTGGYISTNNTQPLRLMTSGATALWIATSDYVGIGTTQPSSTLHVVGSATFSQPVIVGTPTAPNNAATKSYVDSSVASAATQWTTAGSNIYPTITTSSVSIGTSVANGTLNVYASSGEVTYLGDNNSVLRFVSIGGTNFIESGSSSAVSNSRADIQFTSMNDGAPFMIIQGSTGNVGIGTTGPTGALVVQPSTDSASAIQFLNHGGGSIADIDTVNGRVGIGTSAPSAALNIVSSTGSMRFVVQANTPAIIITNGTETMNVGINGNLHNEITSQSNHPLYFAANNTEWMALGPTGGLGLGSSYMGTDPGMGNMIVQNNIGIGTSSPAYNLDVVGTGRFSQPVVVGTPVAANQAATKSYVDTAISAATSSEWILNGTNMYNANTGSIAIGTSSAPFSKLDVEGGLISESGSEVPDGSTDNLLVNGDFELGNSYGWTGITSVVTGGVSGNFTSQTVGQSTILSDNYIPVNPATDVFELQGWFKKTVTGSPTPGILYFGYIAYNSSKTPITTSPCGTYCYFAASALTIPADGNWHKYESTTSGVDTSYPDFPVGTAYVRVLALINYGASSNETTQMDHVTLRRINNGPLFVGNNFNTTDLGDQNQTTQLYTNSSNQFMITPPSSGAVLITGTASTSPSSAAGIFALQGWSGGNGLVAGDLSGSPYTAWIQGGYISNITTYHYPLSLNPLGGNVGVGTTTPSYALDVVGTGEFTQPLIVGTPTAGNHAATKSYVDSAISAATSSEWILSGTNMYNANTGNLSIGTSTMVGGAEVTIAGSGLALQSSPDLNTGTVLLGYSAADNSLTDGVYFQFDRINNFGGVASLHVGRSSGGFGSEMGWFTEEQDDPSLGYPQQNDVTYFNVTSTTESASKGVVYIGVGSTTNSTYPSLYAEHGAILAARSGSVGIGTTNPLGPLQVGGYPLGISVSSTILTGNPGNPATSSVTQTNGSLRLGTNTGNSQVLDMGIYNTSPYGAWIQAGNGGSLGATSPIALNPVGGNVGIGTASPGYLLDVYGTGEFTQPLIVGTPTAANHAATKGYVDSAIASATSSEWILSGTNLYNANSGNVGIGTSTPTNLLEINSGLTPGSSQLRITANGAGSIAFLNYAPGNSALTFDDDYGPGGWIARGASAYQIYDEGSNGLAFMADSGLTVGSTYTPTQRMVLSNAGNLSVYGTTGLNWAGGSGGLVTIGTAGTSGGSLWVNTPTLNSTYPSGLGITGSYNSGSLQSTVNINAYGVYSGGGYGSSLAFSTTNNGSLNEAMRITTGGYVGIATSSPAYILDVVGTARFSQPVIVGTPVAANQAATKNYVDSAVSGGSASGSFAQINVSGNWTLSGAAQGSLNLNGNNITGLNKLTVTTVDPVYNIGGVKYATYGPESVGIVVTSDGKGTTESSSQNLESSSDGKNYTYVLDFADQKQGSDLWLFWQTIDQGQGMQNITLTLTPEGGFAELWYDLVPSKKEIVIHSDRAAQFSYHLSAPRYDSTKWPNTLTSSPDAGVTLTEK